MRNLIYDGSGNRYVYSTKHRDQQPVGAYVCKYGQTTGYGCGNIASKVYQPPDGIGCDNCTYEATFIRIHKDGVNLALSGDSGGPTFLGNTAYGIMTDRYIYDKQEDLADLIYMAVNYTSVLDVSVLTE